MQITYRSNLYVPMRSHRRLTPAPSPVADGAGELARSLVRMKIVSADQPVALTPLAGGVSSDIYRVDLPARRRLRQAGARPPEGRRRIGRSRSTRNRYEVEWMRVAATIVPAAVPAILGEDPEAGAFAMAFLPPERYPVWKALLADGSGTAGDRGAGRRHAGPDPRRHRRPARPRRALCDRRAVPRDSARAVPRHRGPRASGSGAAPARAGGHDRRDQARAGPRRLQPQEHPDRPAGTGHPRRRMRVVRRPGVRSRVRAQPPAAEGGVAPAVAARLRGDVRRAASTPTAPHVGVGAVAGARGAHRGAAAGIAARAHRRQVAGRIPDRRRARDAVRRFARNFLLHPVPTLEQLVHPFAS